MSEFSIGDPVRVLSTDTVALQLGPFGQVVDVVPWRHFPVRVTLGGAAFWFHPQELAHTSQWLSPDCRDGNCQKCYGDAWDTEADAPTSCGCSCH